MSATPEREARIFTTARKLPVEERAFYLEGACAGDALLRKRVEELLQAHDGAGTFLEELGTGTEEAAPPPNPGPTLPVAASALKQPGDWIDRYKLLEKLGEGGCGVVFVAEQTKPVRRRVALKVIKPGMDTKAVVARFEAERQALAMMDHPSIAKVLDAGTTDTGRPYFVMELVRGIRMTDYCDQNQLTTQERLELFIKVCQAIQHAHQKGIIHRDVKPSNILVTLHDGVPVPKVIDFGIAKATEGRLTDATVYTQLHQLIGTPAYMSPEQAEMSGLDIDTRSDIYSLGVLLYELLAGSTPFDTKELIASGIDAMRRTIREKEPVRPSTRFATLQGAELTLTAKRRSTDTSRLMHQLKGDLDCIVMKAMEKDRRRRYETANGLAADVKRHLSNEPVVARPPSTAYRLQKAWGRNKLAFTAAALIAAALVVGISVSTWQAIEASRARKSEKQQRLAAQTERDKAQNAQKEAERSQQAEKQERQRAETREAEAGRLLYVANINLAQQAWDQNNIGRLRELLDETQAFPGRGFEWYYWQRQSHLSLKTLRGHLHRVTSVAVSPDGRWIVTGSRDHTAKVWEAASGRELLTLQGHSEGVNGVAFSPDGQRIVTGSDDYDSKVWETASGHELLTLRGQKSYVLSVAFSPDGQRIVTSGWNQKAIVWDAASGRELLTLQGTNARIWSVAFSPDGRRIVTGSDDYLARVWEAASGRELLTLSGHRNVVRSVAFSPDGRRIVSGSDDHLAKVWEAASGRELRTLSGHRGGVRSAAFSPDGLRVVTGSDDKTAKIWEAASGGELFTFREHSAAVWSVVFSRDGQRIVTGSLDNTAKVWEAAGGQKIPALIGHGARIWSVALSPDGQRVVTGRDDNMARVWEAASGRELLTLTGHAGPVRSVAFSRDGQRILTGSADQTARIWEAASGRELLNIQTYSGGVGAVAFSPDDQRVVTGCWDRTVKVWEAASGRGLFTLKGHTDFISSVAFSPDGQRVVTGSEDKTAKVWTVASVSAEKAGRILFTLKGHRNGVRAVAFSPDGQRIVTSSWDQTAKVWDSATGQELLTLKGHLAKVWSVAFSPDSQRILTGSDDNTAKLWEAVSGRELLTLKGPSDGVNSVAFSPNGRQIVTGSGDGVVRVWEVARNEQVTLWEEEERAAARVFDARLREQTAEQERQRIARTRDSIQRWLILGPISCATTQSGTEKLDFEQIQGEGRLRPKAGNARTFGSVELRWREVTMEDSAIDFDLLLGPDTPYHGVAYAVCYLRAETEQRGLRMLVGSEAQAKVYLNGQQVYKTPVPHGSVEEQDTVPDLALEAGLNVLVFKVVDADYNWMGSLRLTDAQGNPVKGMKVTLDPDAEDSP